MPVKASRWMRKNRRSRHRPRMTIAGRWGSPHRRPSPAYRKPCPCRCRRGKAKGVEQSPVRLPDREDEKLNAFEPQGAALDQDAFDHARANAGELLDRLSRQVEGRTARRGHDLVDDDADQPSAWKSMIAAGPLARCRRNRSASMSGTGCALQKASKRSSSAEDAAWKTASTCLKW